MTPRRNTLLGAILSPVEGQIGSLAGRGPPYEVGRSACAQEASARPLFKWPNCVKIAPEKRGVDMKRGIGRWTEI
jgi:hypothetical protein